MEDVKKMMYQGNTNYLNNDYETKISYKNADYRNATAAILAQRTPHAAQRKKFQALSAKDAAIYADSLPVRKNWENIKDGIEKEILTAKFEQNPDIAKRLGNLEEQLYDGNPMHRNQADCLESLREQFRQEKPKRPGVYVTASLPEIRKGYTKVIDLNDAKDHGLNLGNKLEKLKQCMIEDGIFETEKDQEFIPAYLKRLKTKAAVNHLNTIWKDTARGTDSVLLISEDEDVRNVLASLLERAGCPVNRMDHIDTDPAYAENYFAKK